MTAKHLPVVSHFILESKEMKWIYSSKIYEALQSQGVDKRLCITLVSSSYFWPTFPKQGKRRYFSLVLSQSSPSLSAPFAEAVPTPQQPLPPPTEFYQLSH